LLEQLAPEYRIPLVLRYWEELSYEEIAAAMQVTVATVKSRLFRARQQLVTLSRRAEVGSVSAGAGKAEGAGSFVPLALAEM
jgi:RNA polymerase sigma-70 factor (ECF subfamily)